MPTASFCHFRWLQQALLSQRFPLQPAFLQVPGNQPPLSCLLMTVCQVCANPVAAPRTHPCVALVLVMLELSLSWQQYFTPVITLWQHLSVFALTC